MSEKEEKVIKGNAVRDVLEDVVDDEIEIEVKEVKVAGHEGSRVHSFVSGGTAGVISKTFIAPFERVKMIFQATKERFSYAGAFKKAVDIVRTEGFFFGLWRGNLINCARIFPYAAIVS